MPLSFSSQRCAFAGKHGKTPLLWPVHRPAAASRALRPSGEGCRWPGAGRQLLQAPGSRLPLELPGRNAECSVGILNCALSPIQTQKDRVLVQSTEVHPEETRAAPCETLTASPDLRVEQAVSGAISRVLAVVSGPFLFREKT